MNKVFKKYGVTRQQFNVLRIIRGNSPEPSNINLIKERMLDKMSDASRIVERLKIKGLVVRKVNRLDRRSVDIIITEDGLDLLAKMDNEFYLFEMPLKNLEETEARELNDLLDKIRVS
jgi:DNA-binding MarR family transcriptional regulator